MSCSPPERAPRQHRKQSPFGEDGSVAWSGLTTAFARVRRVLRRRGCTDERAAARLRTHRDGDRAAQGSTAGQTVPGPRGRAPSLWSREAPSAPLDASSPRALFSCSLHAPAGPPLPWLTAAPPPRPPPCPPVPCPFSPLQLLWDQRLEV